MSEPYIGEIRLFSFRWPPRGWAVCNGQILSIHQNQALFSLLGPTYGGNGTTTFALPDLRGRVPIHVGPGKAMAQALGSEVHILAENEMPAHTHAVMASQEVASAITPADQVWAKQEETKPYSDAKDQLLSAAAVSTTGRSEPHENRQPYLTLNYCIAVQGLFPSRN